MTNISFKELDNLDAPISPVDGRYVSYTKELRGYLSEAALNRARVVVEIEWVIALSDGLPASGFDSERKPQVPNLPALTGEQKDALRKIYRDFNEDAVQNLADHEAKTKHDVKAVEYHIKDQLLILRDNGVFDDDQYSKIYQAIHIFCTSEDINNLSYALCIKGAVQEVWVPKVQQFLTELEKIARANLETPMLAKTHGQPATPVTLGKELTVFIYRIKRQLNLLGQQEFLGKINGATGTFGAHFVSVPDNNWPKFAKHYVEEYLGLTYNPMTTQIESHDWQAEVYERVSHIGRILHNFATDIWTYISNEVFIQIPEPGATGSSTMPHKINPIKFENAEANLEISDAIFSKLSETLVTSRMQRDLTDSTTQRNVGVAFGHSLIALGNLTAGIQALEVNVDHLAAELEENPAVLGEAIQTAMRVAGIAGRSGMEDPYEALKKKTRGVEVTFAGLQEFIDELDFDAETKTRLKDLTPAKYIGLAPAIAADVLKEL
jgi:adenylosuccinate lyase